MRMYFKLVQSDEELTMDYLATPAVRIYYPVKHEWVVQPRPSNAHRESTIPLVRIRTEDLKRWLKSKFDIFPYETVPLGSFVVVFRTQSVDGFVTLGLFHDKRKPCKGFQVPDFVDDDVNFPLPSEKEMGFGPITSATWPKGQSPPVHPLYKTK